MGLIPGSGRSPGEGNGNPLQYSCLKNLMYRGVWRATVQGVTKSWTQLSMHTQIIILYILSMAVPMLFSSHSNAAICNISKGISLAKDRFGSTLVPLSTEGEKAKLSLDNTWRLLSECFAPYRGYNVPWCFIFK